MAEITVSLPAPAVPADIRPAHRKVTIRNIESSVTLDLLGLHITNPRVEHTPSKVNWVEQERPGDYPLLLAKGRTLDVMKMKAKAITTPGDMTAAGESARPSGDAERSLFRMRQYVHAEGKLVVAFGPAEAGHWRMTDMTYVSIEREHGTNRIIEAEVDLEFKRASDVPRIR